MQSPLLLFHLKPQLLNRKPSPCGQVFTMAVTQNRIVVGTANRHVWVYDVRKLSEPEQKVRFLKGLFVPFSSGVGPPKTGGSSPGVDWK